MRAFRIDREEERTEESIEADGSAAGEPRGAPASFRRRRLSAGRHAVNDGFRRGGRRRGRARIDARRGETSRDADRDALTRRAPSGTARRVGTLDGKVALVTGGSRGIGRAIAFRLAEAGARVAFTWLSNRAGAEETEAALRVRAADVLSIRANVGNAEHQDKVFGQIRDRFGALDVFVSNAASGVMKPAIALDEKDWARSMDVNALGLLLGAARAVPLMEGRDARIIALTSAGSSRVIRDYAAVGASKAALEAVVRYLAVELAPRGIVVNAVSAGVTDTNSLRFIPGWEGMLADAAAKTPAGRAGTPEEIAGVVYLLCQPEARWIVGQVLTADGGYSLTL